MERSTSAKRHVKLKNFQTHFHGISIYQSVIRKVSVEREKMTENPPSAVLNNLPPYFNHRRLRRYRQRCFPVKWNHSCHSTLVNRLEGFVLKLFFYINFDICFIKQRVSIIFHFQGKYWKVMFPRAVGVIGGKVTWNCHWLLLNWFLKLWIEFWRCLKEFVWWSLIHVCGWFMDYEGWELKLFFVEKLIFY